MIVVDWAAHHLHAFHFPLSCYDCCFVGLFVLLESYSVGMLTPFHVGAVKVPSTLPPIHETRSLAFDDALHFFFEILSVLQATDYHSHRLHCTSL